MSQSVIDKADFRIHEICRDHLRPAKREWTLLKRGLDFADAAIVFAGDTLDFVDDRQHYGETRMISVGHLHGRLVVLVWTQRGNDRHMISMRKANEREQGRYIV